MSTFVLVSGTIFRAPQQKTAKSGKPFTTCTVKSGSDDTGGGDFWSVLCFSESGQLELLRLEVGDAVSVRGKMKLEIFEARISRSIFADAILPLRPAPREKKKAPPAAGSKAADAIVRQSIMPPSSESPTETPSSFYSDDIPF